MAEWTLGRKNSEEDNNFSYQTKPPSSVSGRMCPTIALYTFFSLLQLAVLDI